MRVLSKRHRLVSLYIKVNGTHFNYSPSYCQKICFLLLNKPDMRFLDISYQICGFLTLATKVAILISFFRACAFMDIKRTALQSVVFIVGKISDYFPSHIDRKKELHSASSITVILQSHRTHSLFVTLVTFTPDAKTFTMFTTCSSSFFAFSFFLPFLYEADIKSQPTKTWKPMLEIIRQVHLLSGFVAIGVLSRTEA